MKSGGKESRMVLRVKIDLEIGNEICLIFEGIEARMAWIQDLTDFSIFSNDTQKLFK